MSTSKSPLPAAETLRILLVDDEWCIREVFGTSLSLDGYDVETAGDGREALKKLEEREWDVVITDRAMPRMDGEELASEIKRRWPETSIIMITGLSSAVTDATRAKIDVLLSKPFAMETLREAIVAIERTHQPDAVGGCVPA